MVRKGTTHKRELNRDGKDGQEGCPHSVTVQGLQAEETVEITVAKMLGLKC